ncbi:hypothetical protein BU23DRAFT_277911 [Bimuria novae-zelandiae CBS 107.79]|uniref:BTB domain-containing protein n=1 Tax=Bimuria novae-zelandiae CBS 107.79 TaxID=1447943 RepID=A0A6A5V3W8_9PLEO|nr:hypothetical protein BU23DRAFT_277911 [Bimuria novae-zelandiae CBS 107.79]
MVEKSQKRLLGTLKDLLATGKYSDLTITCGVDTYAVHAMVVCSQSEFLAGAARFPGIESETKNVDLSDEEPAIVKLLMQFLYEGDYAPLISDENLDSEESEEASSVAPHTCCVYDLWGQMCSRKLCQHHQCGHNCNRNCRNFVCSTCNPPPGTQASNLSIHSKLYEIGDRLLVDVLKDLARAKFANACIHFWEDRAFPTVATHAFQSTSEDDKGLWDLVCKTVAEHMELVKDPVIDVLLNTVPGLAVGLLKEKGEKYRWF